MEQMATEKTMKEVETRMTPVKEEKPKEEITFNKIIGIAIAIVLVLSTITILSQYMVSKTIATAFKSGISDIMTKQAKVDFAPIVRQAIEKSIDEKKIISVIETTITKVLDAKLKERVIKTPFHIVAKDETLWGISRYYKIDLKALEKANEDILKTTNGIIFPGMGLRLP